MKNITEKAPLMIASIALVTSIYGWFAHQSQTPNGRFETPSNNTSINTAENSTPTKTETRTAEGLTKLEAAVLTLTEQSQARWARYLTEQASLQANMADLKTQVFALEDNLASQQIGYAHNDLDAQQHSAEQPGSAPDPTDTVSETALGDYIDQIITQNLAHEPLEDTKTLETMAQTQSLMSQLPGVTLNELHCGTGFCRATFARVDGEKPALDALWGQPPFVNQIVEVPQPDGQVVLYFTEVGVSMADIRRQAGAELALAH